MPLRTVRGGGEGGGAHRAPEVRTAQEVGAHSGSAPASALPLSTGLVAQNGGQGPGREEDENWRHMLGFGGSREIQAPSSGPCLFLRNWRGCKTSKAW